VNSLPLLHLCATIDCSHRSAATRRHLGELSPRNRRPRHDERQRKVRTQEDVEQGTIEFRTDARLGPPTSRRTRRCESMVFPRQASCPYESSLGSTRSTASARTWPRPSTVSNTALWSASSWSVVNLPGEKKTNRHTDGRSPIDPVNGVRKRRAVNPNSPPGRAVSGTESPPGARGNPSRSGTFGEFVKACFSIASTCDCIPDYVDLIVPRPSGYGRPHSYMSVHGTLGRSAADTGSGDR